MLIRQDLWQDAASVVEHTRLFEQFYNTATRGYMTFGGTTVEWEKLATELIAGVYLQSLNEDVRAHPIGRLSAVGV